MTALAGIWNYGGPAGLASVALAMVAAQRPIAPHGDAVRVSGSAAFARGLYRLVPEDAYDRDVWGSADGGLFMADSRVDNRDELLDALGLPRSERISDAELLFRAYERWREGLLDRVIGDYAFAAWEPSSETIVLARDPSGHNPLHFHRDENGIRFASTPPGIHAAGIEPAYDPQVLGEFVADIPRSGAGSFFKDVGRVEPGQIVRLSRSGVDTRRFWNFPSGEIRLPRDEDYIEAFRDELERAVRVRLRGAGEIVGAHLSGGLDSGAVASTAARLLQGQASRIVAFTSAPREGFDGDVPRGRIADESALGAEVAALYPNIEHVVIRAGRMSPLDLVGRDATLYNEPLGLPCNQVWLSAVHDAARDRGVRVLLAGTAGNQTISAGGIGALSELVRTGDWRRWWHEVRDNRRRGLRYRGIAAASFGPWLPQPMWKAIKRIFEGPTVASEGVPMLQADLRDRLGPVARKGSRNLQPPKDQRRLRWLLLQADDSGNFRKGILGRWGIDERDPTSDRRLAEFCLRLPFDQLIRDGMTRRIARVALGDRLPPSVLHGPRGYQGADWYESLSRETLRTSLRALEGGAAADLLEFSRLHMLVDGWPPGDWASGAVIGTYRLALLRALSAAHFAQGATVHRTAPR